MGPFSKKALIHGSYKTCNKISLDIIRGEFWEGSEHVCWLPSKRPKRLLCSLWKNGVSSFSFPLGVSWINKSNLLNDDRKVSTFNVDFLKKVAEIDGTKLNFLKSTSYYISIIITTMQTRSLWRNLEQLKTFG